MKLLTLNTHSLQEENDLQKLDWFVQTVCAQRPDVIALQEVNQPVDAQSLSTRLPEDFAPAAGSSVPLKEGNHALRVAERLKVKGLPYSWTWLGVKLGYGKYDEGLALFRRDDPIRVTDCILLSSRDDYQNWKTRKALGIRWGQDWFYTLHMGWWDDGEEPFAAQWQRLEEALAEKKRGGRIWLLGDFNSPAGVRGEGYDLMARSGWLDTYCLADERQGSATVEGAIDGWRDKASAGLRIDHIWCSAPVSVRRSKVIFDGVRWPKISDHFGVVVETDGLDERRRGDIQ